MIPKIIHLCWISGDAYPKTIQMCIDSWQRMLPDYEIVLWDKQRVDSLNSRYLNGAIQNCRYAFAADFIRFYALYTYGGIYLDSDVEVLKSFDELLSLRYFIGKENSGNDWEPAIMGAEAGIPWMKDVLKQWDYGRRNFTDIWGRPRTPVLPKVCAQRLKHYKIHDCKNISDWQYGDEFISRFPSDWFSPKSWETLEMNITENTYCIHHFAATWYASKNSEVKLNVIQRIMKSIRSFASYIKHNIILKNKS